VGLGHDRDMGCLLIPPGPTQTTLAGHRGVNLRSFDEAVHADDEGFLVLVGQLVHLLAQGMELVVVDHGFLCRLRSAHQLIEADL
jgi:hypothetical protein